MIEVEEIIEYVSIEERCYRGCRRRGVVIDGLGVFCAWCYLRMLRKQ